MTLNLNCFALIGIKKNLTVQLVVWVFLENTFEFAVPAHFYSVSLLHVAHGDAGRRWLLKTRAAFSDGVNDSV